MSPADLERSLQHYLRVRAVRQEAVRFGPFLASFDADSPNPFRNYAIPDDDALPSDHDVTTLIAAYEVRDRLPRVEYFPAAAPLVEAPLLEAGFVVERRLPVMTCTPGRLVPVGPPSGIEITTVRDDRDVVGAVRAAHIAFDEGEPGEPDFDRLTATLTEGGGAMIARHVESGVVVGAAQHPAPVDGTTEITGVCVVPDHRGRGIAAALTVDLVGAGFRGGLRAAWLSPEGAGAERMYLRVGFEVASEALHVHHDATLVAGGGGLEPPTSGSKGRRSAD